MRIGVCGGKGGSGKSTISLNLAHALAMEGSRVLVLDMDPQGSAVRWAAERDDPQPFAVKPCLPKASTTMKELDALMRGFDHVVIDAPPRAETVTMRWIVVLSDVVLIPVRASALDKWGTETVLTILEEAKAQGAVPADQRVAFVPSQRAMNWLNIARSFDAEWLGPYGLPILTGTSMRCGYVYAVTRCLTVFEDDRRGKPASEIRKLLAEVKGL